MKKSLKRFFTISAIVFFVILLLGIGGAAIFQNQIGSRIVKEINKQLSTEFLVDDIRLSLFSNFPNAAANLNGIVLKDNQGGVLLEADQISFRLGLLGLISGNYKLDAVKIKQGALNIQVDEQGKGNYLISNSSPAEPGSEPSEGADLGVSIKEAILQDIELIYADATLDQTVNLIVEQANFKGAFTSSRFDLTSNANLISRFVEIGDVRYLPGKELAYDAEIEVDLEEGVYQFKKVSAQLGQNNFHIDGAIEQMDKGPFYDLFLTCKEGSIQGILQLLPAEYLTYLGDFSSKGKLEFDALVRGQKSPGLNPEINANLKLEKGKISSPRLSSDMEEVYFDASYTNGKFRNSETSSLQIKNFVGYFNRELAKLNLRVDNFEDPDLDFELDGALPLNAIYGLFNSPSITAGSGEIEIKKLNLNGRYQDMIRTNRIANVAASGELEFDDASLTLNKEKLIIDRGTVSLEDNQLLINDLKLEGAGTELILKGKAFNVIPVLFADSINSKNAELEFQAELDGRSLDIDRLLVASNLKLTESDTSGLEETVVDSLKEASLQKRERITRFLNGTFTSNIQAFNFNQFEGENFTGLLSFDNNTMEIEGSANAMSGIATLEGTMVFGDRPRLNAEISLEEIDVKTFFKQANNFDQEVLTDKNISGQLTSDLLIYAYWDEKGNFLMDDFNALAEVNLKDGELKDFKMLEAFSSFVKIKDLRNIKLVDLKNYLEIRKETLFIPAMFIQSNALNLTMSGEHNFSNEFNYYLKVNAGQVLTNKFKKYDPSLKPVKARQKGFFNLHYNIFGNLDDYQFKTAKKQVKSAFDRSIYRKQEIEQALARAFDKREFAKEPSQWLDADEDANDNNEAEKIPDNQ